MSPLKGIGLVVLLGFVLYALFEPGPSAARGVLWVLLIPSLYLLPTIVAVSRHKRNTASIAVVNLFLGWTLIGWVVACAWALAYEAPASENTVL